jgi:hypothetical protein
VENDGLGDWLVGEMIRNGALPLLRLFMEYVRARKKMVDVFLRGVLESIPEPLSYWQCVALYTIRHSYDELLAHAHGILEACRCSYQLFTEYLAPCTGTDSSRARRKKLWTAYCLWYEDECCCGLLEHWHCLRGINPPLFLFIGAVAADPSDVP